MVESMVKPKPKRAGRPKSRRPGTRDGRGAEGFAGMEVVARQFLGPLSVGAVRYDRAIAHLLRPERADTTSRPNVRLWFVGTRSSAYPRCAGEWTRQASIPGQVLARTLIDGRSG